MARAVTDAVMTFVLTGKVEKSRKPADSLKSEQVTVFGRAELDFLCQEAKAICTTIGTPEDAVKAVNEHFTRERKQNIESMRLSAGPDAAMFGRFVTGDVYADVDAAVHVAHAMTVHQEESESDYFSAVDDLQYLHPEEGHGAGHINSSELTTGLYYGYVVIDVPLLVENLSGDRALPAQITRRMVHLIATVSPGAKLGSTAPYAYADLVLIEKGDSQPRQLANAFLTPVSLRGDILAGAYAALAAHLKKLDTAFGRTTRKALILGKLPDDKEPHPLDECLIPAGGEISASLSELAKWAACDQEAV
jgi:CRISPR system Cascade subunit CasC